MARNENFRGTVSLMGHSLGSVILFDILSHQTEEDGPASAAGAGGQSSAAPVLQPNTTVPGPSEGEADTLARLFARLGLGEHAEAFVKEGIDLAALAAVTEADMEEVGMPLEARTKLAAYLKAQKEAADGLQRHQANSVTSEVRYVVGPAGTGQPSVAYPRLCFHPSSFYALGSPIGMFQSVRGIASLGKEFRLPTCARFFNIFHPYDPVAYRVESLLDAQFSQLRPVVVPHHKGESQDLLDSKILPGKHVLVASG